MRKNIPAFSLIEIVIGIGLFAMLMVTVNVALIDSFKSSRRVEAANGVKNDAALIMSRISKDIEFSTDIPGCTATTPLSSNTLTLDRSKLDPVTQLITVTRVTYALNPVAKNITMSINGGSATVISSTKVKYDNRMDCPTFFVCTGDFVTVCMGADVVAGTDATDVANAAGGMKFYNQIIRRNNI